MTITRTQKAEIEDIRQIRVRFRPCGLVVFVCVAIVTFTAGCAATPTRESAGGYVDDSTITAKIKADLLQDNKLTASDVHVKTKALWTLAASSTERRIYQKPEALRDKYPELFLFTTI